MSVEVGWGAAGGWRCQFRYGVGVVGYVGGVRAPAQLVSWLCGQRTDVMVRGHVVRSRYGGFSPVQRVTDESTIEVLESIPLFNSLLRAQLVQLAQALRRRESEQGEEVVREGETGDIMYIVESGALEASVSGVGVVMKYGAGAFFGELALVKDEPRKATISATDASVLLELRRSDVTALVSTEQLRVAVEDIEKAYEAALRTQIESIFKMMDLNEDGNLDPMELFKRLSGLDIEEQYIENVFYSMDTCVTHQRNPTDAPSNRPAPAMLAVEHTFAD